MPFESLGKALMNKDKDKKKKGVNIRGTMVYGNNQKEDKKPNKRKRAFGYN